VPEATAPSAVEHEKEKKDGIDALWSELMNSPAPPQPEWIEPPSSPTQFAPAPAVPHTPAVAAPDAGGVAVLAPPIEAIKIEPVPSPVPVPRPEPPRPKVTNYSPVKARPRSKSLLKAWLPAMAVVALTGGLGAYWLEVQERDKAQDRDAAVAANEPKRAPRSPAPPAENKPTAPRDRSAQPTPTQAKARVPAPRPAARQASTVVAKARPATTAAPEPIPSASVAVPTVVTTLPEPPPVTASTSPSAAPQGPFFEPTQVHEAPRVASRVEPDVPEDLRAQARNEMVIVRMLVSQSGRPSRVSLLRKSKAGSRVDAAVIAAVNRWTFSPARRKGEAVSSWYNIGVPVLAN
jgi:TonB family protein